MMIDDNGCLLLLLFAVWMDGWTDCTLFLLCLFTVERVWDCFTLLLILDNAQ